MCTYILHVYYMYIYIIQIQNYASNQAGLKLHPTSFFFLLVQVDADHDLPRVRLEQPPVDMSEASPTSPASVESRQDGRLFFLLLFWLGMFFLDPEDGWGWFSWLSTVYFLCVCLLVLFWEDRKSDDDDASFYECESLAGDQWCTNSSHATISPPRSAVVPYRPCWRLQRNLDETWKPNGNCCEHGWSTSYGSWGETTLWPLELDDILKTARDLPMRTALFQQLRPG